MKKKLWFTLLETLIVLTIFFFVITITLSAYLQIVDLKNGVEARQSLVENTYFIMERLQTTMKNYTIDYEEYYNRKMVWCDSPWDADWSSVFLWDSWVNGYCDRFTAYGNWNSIWGSLQGIGLNDNEHRLYYCSSVINTDETNVFAKVKAIPGAANVARFKAGSGCNEYWFAFSTTPDWFQSFGQYALHFLDTNDDVDFVTWSLNDDDDIDMGVWPIWVGDNKNAKELYLISQDWTHRIMLRRKLVGSGDWDKSWVTWDVASDYLYSIEILKLRGFDAGHRHDFDTNSSVGVYDWVIDTWACDFQEWFVCWDSNKDWIVNGSDSYSSISNIYSWFVVPLHENDGRVNLFGDDVTVNWRNIDISPVKNPGLAWKQNYFQINPHMTILLDTYLYWKNRLQKVWWATLENYWMTVQTSFDVKSFY